MIEFKRVLGLPTAILLVAGIMIGSGTFKKIVPMAQELHNSTWILLAWIVAGIITIFGALTYAGLSTMTTKAGGIYEYLRLIYGDFFAFLFGWSLFTIMGSGAIAALAFVFAQSVGTLFPIPDPLPVAGSGVKLLAVLAIVLLTWVNCRGVRKAGILSNIVTTVKIGGMLLLIVGGLLYTAHPTAAAAVNGPGPAAPTPFAAASPASAAPPFLSAFLGVMLSALWAYDGWMNITFITGEIKDPRRNVPLSIVGGVGIAMTLYVLLNYAYMRVMPLDSLARLGPDRIAAAEVAGVLMGAPGRAMIAVLIMTCTFGALNGCIISHPRVYYRMAQEKAFFPNAGRLHPRFLTPNAALVYTALASSIVVCSGTFDEITNLIIFAFYAFFAFGALGLILMKRKGVITSKVAGYPVVPVIIILFCIALVANTFITHPLASLIGLALIFSGVPFYLLFRRQTLSLQRGNS
jgi:APA family basic amino acid/polyamine antiporter